MGFLFEGKYDFYDEAWSTVSVEAKDVVKKLLCVDPARRASLADILQHKWIKDDLAMICEAKKIMKIEEEFLEECDVRNTNKRSLDNSEPNSQNETIDENAANNRKRLKNLDLF